MPLDLIFPSLHKKEEFKELIMWSSNTDTTDNFEKNYTYINDLYLV